MFLSPKNGSTLDSSTVTLSWQQTGAEEYYLALGKEAYTADYFDESLGTSTSAVVENLPTDGSTVFATLYHTYGDDVVTHQAEFVSVLDPADVPSPPIELIEPPNDTAVNAHALFVSTSGNDSANGQTQDTALRTIAHAAQLAVAGETIYVKAGNYGAEHIAFESTGEPNAPITIEGYHEAPGDRPVFASFDHHSTFDPELMPLLDGGNRASGVAIKMYEDYLIVRNMQIRNYAHGIDVWSASYPEIHELYLSTFGVNDDAEYSGLGIILNATNNGLVTDSVVINAGAEAISLYGDYNRVANSHVFGTNDDCANGHCNNLNSTDYYITVIGNWNTVEDSYAERVGEQFHGGHGIGIKFDSHDNIIRNNVATGFRGESYHVGYRKARDNHFQDNISRHGEMGFAFRGGADSNIVEGHRSEDMRWGVVFYGRDESPSNDGFGPTGSNNIVRNSTFLNTSMAVVHLHDYANKEGYAYNNVFENNFIDTATALFDVRSFGQGNIMKNNTIQNVGIFAKYFNARTEFDMGFRFSGNIENGNGFRLPD
jgi:hypothetical protein